MSIFKGSGVAIVTPMKENGEIDLEVFGELIEDQIAHHTDAIIAIGTTGEAPTLDDDEHLEAIRYCVEKVNGRIPVIAGTGSNNTAHAIMMSKEAEAMGADGLKQSLLRGPVQDLRDVAEALQFFFSVKKRRRNSPVQDDPVDIFRSGFRDPVRQRNADLLKITVPADRKL